MATNPALTWKNVNSRDASNLIKTGLEAGNTLGDAFTGVGETVTAFSDRKSDKDTEQFVADIMAMDTIEEREQAIAAAENSFLNMGTIADKSYEFGKDERALNTQLDLEKRNAIAEDLINTREIGEAKNLLQASEKREDDLLDEAIDYEADIFDRDNLKDAELLEEQYKREDDLLDEAIDYEADIFKRDNLKDAELLKEQYQREDNVRMLEEKFIVQERLYAEMVQDERNLEAAAAEQALADIQAELEVELALIEKDKDIKLKEIEQNSELSQKVLANEIKKGTGLEKTMKRYSMDGTIETDFDSKDLQAYEDVKALMLDTGISLNEFETFFGDNVNWNDNVLGAIIGNPNEFSFSYRGEKYTFGKKGWFRLFKPGGLNQSSAMDGGSMGALEAAIKQDTNDTDAKNLSFQSVASLYKNNTETVKNKEVKKPIEFSKKIFNNMWNNYRDEVRASSDPWALLDVNTFLKNLPKYADK